MTGEAISAQPPRAPLTAEQIGRLLDETAPVDREGPTRILDEDAPVPAEPARDGRAGVVLPAGATG
ncbi:MAG: hypothetical protein J0I49_29910 [Pseudonocardia sp.]|jgi:hypothetical protein|uniref:hypothetical protein n=1 Tax=Pseudonocardia sp. TaxID=60912 RepID=UPI001AC75B20|nr:hypothetical protein [Pseudonocardia sp.]MBN9102280.1 hypothetical protein [Pseudonocardia sp.]